MFVSLDHPRFVRAERAIFTRRVVTDCMNHTCRLLKKDKQIHLDACCQYGADVDLSERDRIIEHAHQIGALLLPHTEGVAWFEEEEYVDPDFPSGRYVRTQTLNGRCIFQHHGGRGCGIHRAAIEGGWDLRGVKPNICRLYPLSYDHDSILISDDYDDYSCARDLQAPTLYQAAKSALSEIFGMRLIAAMDGAERVVCG
jgi:hypothetical protein